MPTYKSMLHPNAMNAFVVTQSLYDVTTASLLASKVVSPDSGYSSAPVQYNIGGLWRLPRCIWDNDIFKFFLPDSTDRERNCLLLAMSTSSTAVRWTVHVQTPITKAKMADPTTIFLKM